MRILRALSALGLAACGSSTSPRHNPLTDSISANGRWVGMDTKRDTMTLILSQTGDSVAGTGNIDDVAIRVAGWNFSPQHCAMPACSIAPEVGLDITDLAGDTLSISAHFVTDTNQIGVLSVSPHGPGPGLPFADSAFTLVRQTATLDFVRKSPGHGQ